MAKENAVTKRALVEHITTMGVTAQVVTVQVRGKSLRKARDETLRAMTATLHELLVRRFVLESCDQDRADVQVIGDTLARLKGTGSMEVHHLHGRDDPLLWIPDIVAWAYGRSFECRKLLQPMMGREISL